MLQAITEKMGKTERALAIGFCAGMLLLSGCGNDKAAAPKAAQQTESKAGQGQRAVTDLSLAGVSLGDSRQEVLKVFGKPQKEKTGNGKIYYYYKGINITLEQDRVIGMATDGGSFATKRGLKEGDSLENVKKSYGTSYEQSGYDGLDLYEYALPAAAGVQGTLRFAVVPQTGKIDYISVGIRDQAAVNRLLAAKTQGSSQPSAPRNDTTRRQASQADEEELRQLSREFIAGIVQNDMTRMGHTLYVPKGSRMDNLTEDLYNMAGILRDALEQAGAKNNVFVNVQNLRVTGTHATLDIEIPGAVIRSMQADKTEGGWHFSAVDANEALHRIGR